MRIVCLVPSLTEYLWALGLNEEVVGVTKFCVHPQSWWRNKTRVGGTKQLNFDLIRQLQPTLIIANKEENTRADIERLQQSYEVLLTDIYSIEDAYNDLLRIGESVHKIKEAKQLIHEIKTGFAAAKNVAKRASFLYFIWRDPYYVVGPNTYIHSLLTHFGLSNACQIERYPSFEDLRNHSADSKISPDLIFLSSEPYPFEDKHLQEFQDLFPASKIMLVDGELCSWYGSRMLAAPPYMEALFLVQ